MSRKLYKVLVDGKSCHGGKLAWSLPRKHGKRWLPGDWHSVYGDIEICSRGIHLTAEPYAWYKLGCEIFEAEGRDMAGGDDNKSVWREARLLKPIPKPDWLCRAEDFIASIKNVPFCKPDGKPLRAWRLFTAPTLDAAGDAARAAAWDAAWAAALKARTLICSDLKISRAHIKYANARWQVWEKGYCLLCDVNGVLYVYAKGKK